MSGFTQQLALLKSGEYNNVYPNTSWTLQDYKDMMESIGKLEIIQNMGEDYDIPPEVFILNPDYVETEEEEECEVCDTKTKTTIKTYGCMDMSVCKNCEEPNECEKCGDKSFNYSTEIYESLGDGYYCHTCIVRATSEADKYKLWKSQSIEITCRKCGDIGYKHDWNDDDDDMEYGTCGACEEEEE